MSPSYGTFEFSAELLTADIADLLSVIANFDFTIGQVIDGITVSCSTPIQVVVTDARQ